MQFSAAGIKGRSEGDYPTQVRLPRPAALIWLSYVGSTVEFLTVQAPVERRTANDGGGIRRGTEQVSTAMCIKIIFPTLKQQNGLFSDAG